MNVDLRRRTCPRLLVVLFGMLGATGTTNAADTATNDREAAPVFDLPTMAVTTARAPQPVATIPYAVQFLGSEELSSPTAMMVDEALARVPAFSLFRRSSSLTANPTAQGVSLRGLGPSGASRSLVLLDEVPLNDPFGGWVAWAKIPSLAVTTAEISPGGGAGLWGNAALGGVVHLRSRDLSAGAASNHGRWLAEAGTHQTYRSEIVAYHHPGESANWRLGARWFSTDGFHQYDAGKRGPVDRPLDSKHRLAHAAYAQTLPHGSLEIGGRWFDEQRGNGTPVRDNESREVAGHARWRTDFSSDASLEILAYAQDQSFAARFSAVDAARATESPVLDQFDVPARALGFAAVASWRHGADQNQSLTSAGVDYRTVRGETREAYFYDADEARFLRNRFAGGEQMTAGIFLNHQYGLTDDVSLQLSGRLDWLENTDGHRRDINVDTGAPTILESYENRRETEFTPAVGLTWRLASDVRLRAAARRAFRLPTLNEYYRPFRVGDVTTNANPDLEVESLTGFDAAIEYTPAHWRLSVGAFSNDLRDAVSNVTLSTTPTGTTRQRQNIERISVDGVELQATWQSSDHLALALSQLWVDATFERAPNAPALVGRTLPQVPGSTTTLGLIWSPREDLQIEVSGRAVSRQFEDDANTLPLASAAVFDVAIQWHATPHLELRLAADNVFDERIETGRDSDGLVSLAPSTAVRLGTVLSW